MKVVLMAAGLGSRLGELTRSRPKAMVTVGGQSLLRHGVRFAQRLQPEQIVVVGGFGFAEVAAEVEAHRLPVTLVENTAFRDGNLLTLMAARSHVEGADMLVMNVDHIYRPAIAARVAPVAADVTAHIDTDRTLGDDDMKVLRDGEGRVRRIAKTLTEWDAGYVGMTRVPAAAQARYWAEADAALASEGRAIHVERILARLAETDRPPHCRDISGHGWLEVDFAEERDRAEAEFARGGWL